MSKANLIEIARESFRESHCKVKKSMTGLNLYFYERNWRRLRQMGESFNQMEIPMLKLLRNLFLLTLFISGSALASGQPFQQAEFDALQKAGKPIVVMIHASWCPTCKAQEPILDALLKEPRFQKIAGLRVDFDDQKNIVKEFHATYQSTLIVFKGGKEVGRSTGDTTKEGIAGLLQKAL